MMDQSKEFLLLPNMTFISNGLFFFAGTVIGFLTSRFTRTKAESDTQRQRLLENANNLVRIKDEKYLKFLTTLEQSIKKMEANEFTIDDMIKFMTSGDLYFSELRNIADACIGKEIPEKRRNQTFLPALKEAVEISLPLYYEKINLFAEELGMSYSGELKRSNYESIYLAVEKWGLLPSVDNDLNSDR